MAEVLAILGGGAAATQLLHYGLALLSTTSALSRQIRHAPDRIQSWIDQSSTMLSMLRNLCRTISELDSVTTALVQQCNNDIAAVRLLLRPYRSRIQARRFSTAQQILFVLRREDEVERLMESFRRTFSTMTLSIIAYEARLLDYQ
tara:strand:+ start:4176 stop:4613 length:438 start_codon:yes stop_codon:yes gene_type:complete